MRYFFIKIFKNRTPLSIDNDYHAILSDHSQYYNRLIPELQADFRTRLFQLLHVLAFSGIRIPKVTREMRAVIGCAIVEITFGLKKYLPSKYTNINVLPRRYMYPGYGQPFLGHIDYDTQSIYFSWQDVQNGYQIPNDAVNVALHEMAHVLEVEDSYSFLITTFFSRISWNKWAEIAHEKMLIIRQNENKFLKSYGGINMKEMFAVCIETFFEQSDDFKYHLPELYQTLVELLGQDPTVEGNPLLSTRM